MLLRSAALALAAALAAPAAAASNVTAFDHSFVSIDGEPMPLAEHRGKVLLIVNTASQCGFTGQYAGLQDLWEAYRDQGLVLIGVPSNDFGGQEPGTASEIKEFCEVQFGLDFPLAEKSRVSGADAHPFYRWARAELGAGSAPRWNFHKYLIGRDGRAIAGYSAMVKPGSRKMTDAIEAALREPPPSS